MWPGQAWQFRLALRLVRAFEEVRIWSRTPEHAAQFAAEVGARAMAAEDAVRGADVIVTASAQQGLGPGRRCRSPPPCRHTSNSPSLNLSASVGGKRRLGCVFQRRA